MKQEILQTVVMSEWEEENENGVWGEESEIEFKVDLIVLVKNKVTCDTGVGWEVLLDCLTPYFTFKPMTVELCFLFPPYEGQNWRDTNKSFQIGNFYRVTGGAVVTDNFQKYITIYFPEYEQVEAKRLPHEFAKLLTDHLTANDLCFEHCGLSDHMKHQYEKTELFPWCQERR